MADRFSIVMLVAQPARFAGPEDGRFKISIRKWSAQDRTFEDVAHQSALRPCVSRAFGRLSALPWSSTPQLYTDTDPGPVRPGCIQHGKMPPRIHQGRSLDWEAGLRKLGTLPQLSGAGRCAEARRRHGLC